MLWSTNASGRGGGAVDPERSTCSRSGTTSHRAAWRCCGVQTVYCSLKVSAVPNVIVTECYWG